MEQKLAESFADLYLLAHSMVGESIRNDSGVMLVDDVILGIASREDD